MQDTLTVYRELIVGEMRHRVVRRKRDCTYWYVAEYRNSMGKWLPMQVQNQNGKQNSAEKLFHIKTS